MFFSILLSIALIISSAGIGRKILQLMKCDGLEPLPKFLAGFAVGFGLIGNLFLLLGFLQLYNRALIIVIIAATTILALFWLKGLIVEFKVLPGKLLNEASSEKTWFALSAIFLLIYLIRGLLPPTGIDGLMYHLPVPMAYLKNGGFFNMFYNRQANLIMLNEINFIPILISGNGTGCKFLAFFIGVCLTSVLGIISKELAPTRSVFMTIAIFLSLTFTMANFSSCDVDITMAFYACLGFYILFSADSRGKILLLFLVLGFCVQTKIFGFFSILCIAFTAFFFYKEDRKKIMPVILLALIFSTPWILKGLVYTEEFTKSAIGATKMHNMAIAASKEASLFGFYLKTLGEILKRLALAPWNFAIFTKLNRMDSTGPLFLILLPGLFFIRQKEKVKPFLLFALSYIFLIILYQVFREGGRGASLRYSAPWIALLCPLGVYAWQAGFGEYTLWKKAAKFLIILTILFNLVICLKRYRNDIISVLTFQSQDKYLEKNLMEYPTIKYANENLPPNSMIMTTTCFGTFYVKRPYYCGFKRYQDLSVMVNDFKELGVTHLLANDVLGPTVNRTSWKGEFSELIYEKNDIFLYKLKQQ